MPGGDRTGPMGAGPMTGWGRGYCAGSWGRDIGARGFRGGAGGYGRGWRHRYWATGRRGWWDAGGGYRPRAWLREATDEQRDLEREIEWLESELGEMRARLEQIRGAKDD